MPFRSEPERSYRKEKCMLKILCARDQNKSESFEINI